MSMSNKIKTLIRHPLETVICTLIVLLVLIIFTQVVTRYLLHTSLSWSEELARYMLLWLGMLSAAYGFKIKGHFALLFLVNRLPAHIRRYTSAIGSIMVVAVMCVFVSEAVELTYSVRNQVGPATGLSKAIPYSSSIVGGILIVFYAARNGWDDWRNQEHLATKN